MWNRWLGRSRRFGGRRFTLVEILFVVLIVLLLVGMLLPVVTRSRAKARYSRWMSTMRSTLNDDRLYLMYDFEAQVESPGVLKNRCTGFGAEGYEQARFDLPYSGCTPEHGRWPTKGGLHFGGTAYLENAEVYGMPKLHEEFAVIVWVKFDSVDTTQNLCTISTGSTASWQLGVRNHRLTVWRHGGTPLAQELTDLKPDLWYQIAYVYRDNTHWLYRDGNVVATGAGPPDWGPVDTLSLGRWVDGTEYLHGVIDEWLYYREAIGDDEVYNNYLMGQP